MCKNAQNSIKEWKGNRAAALKREVRRNDRNDRNDRNNGRTP